MFHEATVCAFLLGRNPELEESFFEIRFGRHCLRPISLWTESNLGYRVSGAINEEIGRFRPIDFLCVTSRQVVWLFFEQLRFEFVPILHRLQGRLAAQG